MKEKYPTEALTEKEARDHHPVAEVVHVYSIGDQDGDGRLAIFVWQSEEDKDKDDPVGLYWLK